MKKLAAALREIVKVWEDEFVSGGSPSFGDMERAFEWIADELDPPKVKKVKKAQSWKPAKRKKLRKVKK